MMKKIGTYVLIFTFILGLAACGKSDLSQETQSNTSAIVTVQDEAKETTETTTTEEVSEIENEDAEEVAGNKTEIEEEEKVSRTTMNVSIGDSTFVATLENNAAVDELVAMIEEEPIVLSLNDYSGFEKVGPLGRNLTTSDVQMTTDAGDIVLYSGNQIVMFYGSNSWSYTLLAHIDDLSGWADALGGGDVTVTLSLD